MPDYATPRRGVEYSEALLEAAAVAPIHRAMIETFEVYHPTGTPEGPIYLVANPVDVEATKEATAERDAGEAVVFMAAPIVAERQEESDTAAAPEKALRLSNVSGLATDALRLSRGSLEPWHIIERIYASDDLSAPALLPPLSLLIDKVQVTPTEVAFTASYGDPVNVQVPAQTFRREHYPALVQ